MLLHLAPKYRPHTGGVEKHVALLSEELQRRGYRMVIITDRYRPDLPAWEEVEGETVIRIPIQRVARIPGSGLIRMWLGIFAHFRLILKADLIHCHDFSTLLKWFLPFRLLLPWKPIHVTFHGWEGDCPPKRLVVIARKIVEALTRTNLCIGSYIVKWYGAKPTAVSHGCVSTLDYAANKTDRAVFLGRLEPDVGILIYLEALALLAEQGIRLPLDVYGDGSQAELAVEFTRIRGIDVTFHGFVPNAATRLASARFAFVSGYLAILEAMVNRALVFSVYDNPLKHDYLASLPTGTLRIASSARELAEQLRDAVTKPVEAEAQLQIADDWARAQSVPAMADLYERLWYGTPTIMELNDATSISHHDHL